MNIQEAVEALNDQSTFPKAAVLFKLLGLGDMPKYRRVLVSDEHPRVTLGSGVIVDSVPINRDYYPSEVPIDAQANTLEDFLEAVLKEEHRFLSRGQGSLLYLSTRGWGIWPVEGSAAFQARAIVSAIWL